MGDSCGPKFIHATMPQTAAAAAGYRAGKIWTPTGPTWNVTVVKMSEAIVPRSAAIASRELKRDRPPAR